MTLWDVEINGSGLQGGGTDFASAVESIAYAHANGLRWDVRVRGPRDSAHRTLDKREAALLVAAVTKDLKDQPLLPPSLR